jgi:hypothetical protein
MKAHLRYFRTVMRHKLNVLRAGLKLGGIPLISLLLHDWDKFLPSMWFAYVDYFERGDRSADAQKRFDRAWNAHQKRNRHHWQAWLLMNDTPRAEWGAVVVGGDDGMPLIHLRQPSGPPIPMFQVMRRGLGYIPRSEALARALNRQPEALEMSERDAREMVADWLGASMTYGGDTREWYLKRRRTIILHPKTRKLVELLLLGAKERASLNPITQPEL